MPTSAQVNKAAIGKEMSGLNDSIRVIDLFSAEKDSICCLEFLKECERRGD
jgi:hypothetical protein